MSWKTLGNFFLCGCIDLVKTSVSVSSRNKISFGLLFGAVNGCEETHLSKWGLQPVQWGAVLGVWGPTSQVSDRWALLGIAVPHSTVYLSSPCNFLPLFSAVILHQRWQMRMCPLTYFPNFQPIVLAEAAADVELIKVPLQWLRHRSPCSLPSPVKMLMLSGWDKPVSGGTGELFLTFIQSELAVTSYVSLCAAWDAMEWILRSCCPPACGLLTERVSQGVGPAWRWNGNWSPTSVLVAT